MIVRICIVVAICLFLVGALSSCGGPKIVGTWEVFDEGKSVKFTFNEDGTGVVTNNDFGPELFKYKIDYAKKPIWLDVTPKDTTQAVKLIVEFETADKFRSASYIDSSKRPTSFSEKKRADIVTFTRFSKH